MRKIVISNIVILIALVLVGYWFYSKTVGIGVDKARDKAERFFKENSQGVDIKVVGVNEENNLYKLDLTDGKQKAVFYMTKDGSKMFPQVIEVEADKDQKKPAEPEETAAVELPKADKPSVELFVMSYCPYGLQMEKGIWPAINALKDKIDFKLRFVNYAMHDKKEIDENLRQYCIQKQEPSKLLAYVQCFVDKGNTNQENTNQGNNDQCLQDTKIDTTKLNSCVAQSDKQFKVTENYNDKKLWMGDYPRFDVDKDLNEKYGVEGSPTVIINGVDAQIPGSKRDAASLLGYICSAFNEQPAECQQSLSSDAPKPGFGTAAVPVSAGSTGGSCGN